MATKHTDTKGTYYLVEKGDTLWGIAETHYGDGTKYKQLAAYNNITNPDLIYVNQKIYTTNVSGSSSSNSNAPTITAFGLQSDSDNTLFATWTWNKTENLDGYKVLWTYGTGDGVAFVGDDRTISYDKHSPASSRQSLYNIPSNAKVVRFKVKPISKTYTKNNKETSYWTANWSTEKVYNVTKELPPETPPTPTVTLEEFDLTASLANIGELNAKTIQFQVVRDDSPSVYKTGTATIKTASASYKCTVHAGSKYKVRCRSCRDGIYSDWSDYSSSYDAPPAAVSGITSIKATSETSVRLEWEASKTADSYEIEYTTEKRYFDGSNGTTTQGDIKDNHYELIGLETGHEYFFRVRAVKGSDQKTAWCEPKSITLGDKPAAPTTWSSTSTAIAGETVDLYWVHNSSDGSSQSKANLEITIGDVSKIFFIDNYDEEDKRDKTSRAILDTAGNRVVWYDDDGEHIGSLSDLTQKVSDGSTVLWRVQTFGVVENKPSDWSVQRTIEVYAPPSLELDLRNAEKDSTDTITSFPFYISAVGATSSTQSPIGYHLSIRSDEVYETVDSMGNPVTVNIGDEVYSKYFDIFTELFVELSAYHVDLENNVKYTIECTVTMSSGLTATETLGFNVAWTETEYEPTAEISIDSETYTASIRPYCEISALNRYEVTRDSGAYVKSNTALGFITDVTGTGSTTTTGEAVLCGVDVNDNTVYYCEVEEKTPIENVYMSVYRREFDGSFTEIGTNLDGAMSTTVTDPHPSLDLARYRIVAIDKDTGSVSFSDPAGYPVGGVAVIIQWNEAWSAFDAIESSALEQPAWSGSLLKLPYNIDVSDSNRPDVALVEYIGRSHPISYYGTQIGSSSSWSMEIPKSDKETLYGLRRLSRWMGDVYVREPSGSGYWANITVSFSQKHCEVTIPVTLTVTRVEGGA